jgi:predicted GIY-YIG superfamily endonuclease
MAVYLLHFVQPYVHARHYIGHSPEVQARVNAHLHGRGARLTQVVHDAGIGMIWVRTWEDGDRKLERKLKNWHNGSKFCPICCGEAVQMPLMPWMPAYVPEPEQAEQDGAGDDAPQQIETLWDTDTDNYADDILDREFWARGQW